jgi:hypothetical protein
LSTRKWGASIIKTFFLPVIFSISHLPIDFSLRLDFVESLPNYFAVMFPARLLIFATTLDRVDYLFSGAFSGCWQVLTLRLPLFPSQLFFFRNNVFSDLSFTVSFAVAQTIFSASRARITEAAPSTVRIPTQRRQS